MLTKAENHRLTQVGPGTPMGNLLRRYWHPIAARVELDENPVKKARLLGEGLVLYRDHAGNLGLIDEPCPHRRVSMEYGIPENEGLRCPYHGWLFNHEGRCLEQPAEPWNSTFKDRVTTRAYPVQELGGLVFAYLGPQPAPLIPRYDVFVWDNAVRQIGGTLLPCNLVQCMENSLDPVHVEWLHSYLTEYSYARKGLPSPNALGLRGRRHQKIGFDRFEHGVIKRRVYEGFTEEDHGWQVGHPVIFPNILRVGRIGSHSFEIRTPVDDTHTYHWVYNCWRPRIPLPVQTQVPFFQIPHTGPDGNPLTDYILGQDFMAWVSQGPVAQRDKEHLGQSDIGVIMYRQLLEEQIALVERGEDPMEVYRNPAENEIILLPSERVSFGRNKLAPMQIELDYGRFSPLIQDVQGLFQVAMEREARQEPLLPDSEAPSYPVDLSTRREVVFLPP